MQLILEAQAREVVQAGLVGLESNKKLVLSTQTGGDGPWKAGDKVHLFQDVGAQSQKFVMDAGLIKLAAQRAFVLTVVPSGGHIGPGCIIGLWTCVGPAQKWIMDGPFIRLAAKPEWVLGAVMGAHEPEGLQLQAFTGGDLQRWVPILPPGVKPGPSIVGNLPTTTTFLTVTGTRTSTQTITTTALFTGTSTMETQGMFLARLKASNLEVDTHINFGKIKHKSGLCLAVKPEHTHKDSDSGKAQTLKKKAHGSRQSNGTERHADPGHGHGHRKEHRRQAHNQSDNVGDGHKEVRYRARRRLNEQGQVLSMAPCTANLVGLQWSYDGASGQIRSRAGFCLASSPNLQGEGNTSMQPCDRSSPQQQWQYDGHTGELRSRTDVCLASSTSDQGVGNITMQPCDTSRTKQWSLLQSVCKQLHNRHGMCIDSPDRCKNHGEVHIWECFRDLASQQWIYDAQSRHIKSSRGLCLTTSSTGEEVYMYRCDALMKRQEWEYDAASGLISSVFAVGMCLTADDPNTNGVKLHLTVCVPTNVPQQWDVVELPCSAGDATFCEVCDHAFRSPSPGYYATGLNGVRLPDTCIDRRNGGLHKVFVIGDWGGVWSPKGPVPADHRAPDKFPEITRDFVTGVDDCAQQRVASQMAARALTSNPDYILNVGDNFYWSGVDAHCGTPVTQVTPSQQFKWVYEDVYKGPGLDGKPWLGVLGNHDYGGFKYTQAWDQAISYTWNQPEGGRWVTPAQFWRSRVIYPEFSVDYFFLDSNVWDTLKFVDPQHSICNHEHNTDSDSCGAEGPTSSEDCPKWFKKLWEDQSTWFDDGLSNSQTEWQIVVTHFPPSFGAPYWVNISRTFGIDLIVSGHNHNQELHHLEKTNAFRPTAVIVSGGGGGITSQGKPDQDGRDTQYGFFELTLSRTEIKIQSFSHGGHLMLSTFLQPRLTLGKR